eukprot:TRINITY_DN18744_c0_g1_i1.p1 TRINITY_DN18744_c0_g1~~TRINITY_DN18744_c0_g1_i1.p1  ORF type:complete len:324 (+),score=46.31 TRINITY_DN18744_c0_g1_i1:134-1105(+)
MAQKILKVAFFVNQPQSGVIIKSLQQWSRFYVDHPTKRPKTLSIADDTPANDEEKEPESQTLHPQSHGDTNENGTSQGTSDNEQQSIQSREGQKMMDHLAARTGDEHYQHYTEQQQKEIAQKIKNKAKKVNILFGPTPDYLQPHIKTEKEPDQTFQEIQEVMAHPEKGYRELGQFGQEGEDADFNMSRLHPKKIFQPGDTYTPEDLNPFESARDLRKERQDEQKFLKKPPKPKFTEEDVKKHSSFTNVPFLVNFMSETGKIVPMRVSKLKKKYHRQVERNIKTARQMALMPPEGKPVIGLLDKETIKRIQAYQEEQQKLVTEG